MALLRSQVAEMATVVVATTTQASWFEWLGLFALERQPFLSLILCVGGWEVATG